MEVNAGSSSNRENPMKKLKMTVEELKVISFETEAKDDQAEPARDSWGSPGPACPTVPTRYGTCCTP